MLLQLFIYIIVRLFYRPVRRWCMFYICKFKDVFKFEYCTMNNLNIKLIPAVVLAKFYATGWNYFALTVIIRLFLFSTIKQEATHFYKNSFIPAAFILTVLLLLFTKLGRDVFSVALKLTLKDVNPRALLR